MASFDSLLDQIVAMYNFPLFVPFVSGTIPNLGADQLNALAIAIGNPIGGMPLLGALSIIPADAFASGLVGGLFGLTASILSALGGSGTGSYGSCMTTCQANPMACPPGLWPTLVNFLGLPCEGCDDCKDCCPPRSNAPPQSPGGNALPNRWLSGGPSIA